MSVRLALVATALLIAGTSPTVAQDVAPARGTGTYHNPQYGYLVRLPVGITWEMSPAPFPNHGFQVALDTGDTLSVDAWSTDTVTVADTVGGESEMAQECTVAWERPTLLGGLAARELVSRCAPARAGDPFGERREVQAMRGAILYIVGIRRAGGVSQQGGELFEAVRLGFSTTPR
jgi:hypothetical protein